MSVAPAKSLSSRRRGRGPSTARRSRTNPGSPSPPSRGQALRGDDESMFLREHLARDAGLGSSQETDPSTRCSCRPSRRPAVCRSELARDPQCRAGRRPRSPASRLLHRARAGEPQRAPMNPGFFENTGPAKRRCEALRHAPRKELEDSPLRWMSTHVRTSRLPG